MPFDLETIENFDLGDKIAYFKGFTAYVAYVNAIVDKNASSEDVEKQSLGILGKAAQRMAESKNLGATPWLSVFGVNGEEIVARLQEERFKDGIKSSVALHLLLVSANRSIQAVNSAIQQADKQPLAATGIIQTALNRAVLKDMAALEEEMLRISKETLAPRGRKQSLAVAAAAAKSSLSSAASAVTRKFSTTAPAPKEPPKVVGGADAREEAELAKKELVDDMHAKLKVGHGGVSSPAVVKRLGPDGKMHKFSAADVQTKPKDKPPEPGTKPRGHPGRKS